MDVLQEARGRLIALCAEQSIDLRQRVSVAPLSPDDAVGERADAGLAIKRGRERVIEAAVEGARGQAFTDSPASFRGTLEEALALDLAVTSHRAILVAALNAVLKSRGIAQGTLHCRDEAPSACGPAIARLLAERFDGARVGLIGLQPAILAALVERFGPERIHALDLNPDNIGQVRCGVTLGDGSTDLPAVVGWCDLGLATGSTVVNGTIDEILRRFDEAGKPLLFFGNTIAGVAALLGLERICPFGR